MFNIFKYYLLFNIICNSVYTVSDYLLEAHDKSDPIFILEEVVLTILQNCNLKRQNVVIFNNGYDLPAFKSLSNVQPLMAVSLLNYTNGSDETCYGTTPVNVSPSPDNIAMQLIILIVDQQNMWHDVVETMNLFWLMKRDCVIIVVPHQPENSCSHAGTILRIILRSYIYSTYYICLDYVYNPFIFTFDIGGDTEPRFWKGEWLTFRSIAFRLYHRYFRKETICEEFLFNRTNPYDSFIVYQYDPRQMLKSYVPVPPYLYDDRILRHIHPSSRRRTVMILKLMKVKSLHSIPDLTDVSDPLSYSYYQSHTPDIRMASLAPALFSCWIITIPDRIDYYVILSHNTGFATPLEKIARFYGYITLVALIIISAITFIIIWFISDKRIYSAAFDIVRLWANAGIAVTMSTIASRLYFSCVFLFFLIIQATFSGNLTKFLTKAELRKNVDTIEDLKNSQVEVLYNYGYNDYDPADIPDTIKVEGEGFNNNECAKKISLNSKSACLTDDFIALRYIANNYTNYYMGKKLGQCPNFYGYRKRMPWEERFNWAMMFLTDTRLISYHYDKEKTTMENEVEAHIERSHIKFRAIAMNDLIFAFILLATGLMLGLIAFIFEILYAVKLR